MSESLCLILLFVMFGLCTPALLLAMLRKRLRSGESEWSNGIHRRDTEPIHYWADMVMLAAGAVLFFSICAKGLVTHFLL